MLFLKRTGVQFPVFMYNNSELPVAPGPGHLITMYTFQYLKIKSYNNTVDKRVGYSKIELYGCVKIIQHSP